jgi:hypothetical protein
METAISLKIIDIVEALLNENAIDGFERELSCEFEHACFHLFYEIRKHHWYDGVIEMQVSKRKQRQLEIKGRMWVADYSNKQWLEPFCARITDKRLTKQGVWLKVKIGEYEAQGNLYDLL